MNPPSNWNQLKSRCANSACNTANGGCTIVLSDDFVMGSYTSEIVFGGKTISIWGQGKVLDASGDGRFFNQQVSYDSFLELHDVVLQNGQAVMVSGRVLVVVAVVENCSKAVLRNFLDFSAAILGGGHATSRAELSMLRVVPL
jgi:hypothetical protein